MMTDKLSEYRKKRDFKRTAEPSGELGSDSDKPLYVMHKHAASHDHFDLRLEQDGVLRSWALPKGPSLEPGERRLAVAVEDHPVDYGTFEGVIPKGEYGGGTVMLWDTGHWQMKSEEGGDKITFELQGEKLRGQWSLVKMHGRKGDDKGKNWLLIKRRDEHPVTLEPDDRSVITGRNMDEIAKGKKVLGESTTKTKTKAKAKSKGRSKGEQLPEHVPPQLALLSDHPPGGKEWVHEIKYDGYRIHARVDDGQVTLLSRNGKDWTRRFPGVAAALAQLPVEQALLDGEIASFGADGASSFQALQNSLSEGRAAKGHDIVYQVFDLLYLDGDNLMERPLLERKQQLAQVLAEFPGEGPVRYADHFAGAGDDFYQQLCELGLEGMVSKDGTAPYSSGRGDDWVKIKCSQQDEFVVGGYTSPSGRGVGFGSLLLGQNGADGLEYCGRVGTGFSTKQRRELLRRLQALQAKKSPFAGEVPNADEAHWTAPVLVADVSFTERTDSGALRHPSFRGLREDKGPQEVQRGDTQGNEPRAAPAELPQSGGVTVEGVVLTHPERVLFPDQALTKLDLARYYQGVAEWVLPHLRNRPLSLLRCPQGHDEECFFQKHPGKSIAPHLPRVAVPEKNDRRAQFLYVRELKDLIELVQFGVLELHPWGSTNSELEKPDRMVFDLDPGPGISWKRVVEAARGLRERLDALGLPAFAMATGGKGLHVVVPLQPSANWDQVKETAHQIATLHAEEAPQRYTVNMAKRARQGRIFIDYLRNGRGNTSVAAYCPRAREGGTVALPLRWDELSESATANRYPVPAVRRRLSALKADPWEDFDGARVKLSSALRRQLKSA